MAQEFPPEIFEKLGHYVYRLIDPRNGETFYVGKGQRNRVFAHVQGQLTFPETADEEWGEDAVSTKISTIREIIRAGLEVIHIIHRHGMKEDEAWQVEAALIDVYPALTNEMSGHDVERGPAHVKQLIDTYCAEEMQIDAGQKILAIKIRQQTITGRETVYDAVRWAWRLDKNRAEKADYIFALVNGLCEGVFIAEEWRPWDNEDAGRFGFSGRQAPPEICKKYVRKRIPAEYGGGQNPIRYINC